MILTHFTNRRPGLSRSPSKPLARRAFTLVETIISLALAGVSIAGLISGFVQSARQAETSSYVLAAQGQALEGLEQVRAAKWDPQASPPVDQVVSTNFPAVVGTLDVPGAGRSMIYATNKTYISTVSTNPVVRMIRVECVWRFLSGPLTTNSVATYRSPDQ